MRLFAAFLTAGSELCRSLLAARGLRMDGRNHSHRACVDGSDIAVLGLRFVEEHGHLRRSQADTPL